MGSFKRKGIVLAAIVGIVLIGILVVQHFLNANTYRGRIETALSGALGRDVQLGNLSFSLFAGSLVAEAPVVAEDPAFGAQPFLTAANVHIGVETGALIFKHQLHITSFIINQPRINLIRATNGTWNYSSIGQEGKRKAPTADTNSMMPGLTVAKIDVTDGTVSLGAIPQQGAARVYNAVNISVQNFSFAKQFPFTVAASLPAGGSLNLTGNAGPLNSRDASLTPVNAQVTLKQADLVAAGLVTPQKGISGVVDLDTNVISNGQLAQAKGKLHITKLKLAANGSPSATPVDAHFALDQNLQALSGKIDSATVQIGRATANVNGAYQATGNVTTLHLQAAGQSMPIDDLVAFLPSLGVQLPSGAQLRGGSITTNLSIDGPTTAPTLTGPISIANTQLAGFDLGQKLASIQAFTGAKTGSATVIQSLSTNLRYGPGGTRTDNLNAVVSGLGSASGAGSIAPGGALNYDLMVKLNTSGAAGIATQAMSLLPGLLGTAVSQTTKNGIPVTIGGTTSNPTFTPNFSRLTSGAVKSKPPAANPLGNILGGFIPH